MTAKRLAFVIPWYGQNILGGAELVCRTTAEHLAAAGVPVEVLTTCARDLFGGWQQNFHPAGKTAENGVPVRRFPLTVHPLTTFGTLNERLIAGLPVSPEDEVAYFRQSVNSSALYQAIRDERGDSLFIFLPYPFGTTFFGAQVAPESSMLMPCLHDEGYARMKAFVPVFQAVQGCILLSAPERDLACRLYGLAEKKLRLWGAGVDTSGVGDGERFRAKYGLHEPFLLSVGRRDATKNTPLLIDYFCRYVLHHGNSVKLVLAGSGEVKIPARFADRVLDVGTISEQDKLDANAAALALVQPSVNESFSFVIMESWLQRTPVLVNAGSAVMANHAVTASGGLPFNGSAEFAGCVDYLLEHPTVAERMGENGRRYVLANYAWDRMVERYAQLLG